MARRARRERARSLRTALAELRRTLGDGHLVATRETVGLARRLGRRARVRCAGGCGPARRGARARPRAAARGAGRRVGLRPARRARRARARDLARVAEETEAAGDLDALRGPRGREQDAGAPPGPPRRAGPRRAAPGRGRRPRRGSGPAGRGELPAGGGARRGPRRGARRAPAARGGHAHAFTHALVREAIYGQLSGPRRALLHARIADALECTGGDDAELAHDLLLAGGPREKAVEYSLRAGRRAGAQLAYEDAARHFERVLGQGGRRGELLLGLGEAHLRMGDVEASRGHFSAAADAAREGGDAVALAHAALGRSGLGATVLGHDPQTVALLEQALAGLGEREPALRARLMGRLAIELYHSPPAVRREELSARAVALAREAGAPDALADALSARHVALWSPPHLDERFALADEMLALATAAGDRDRVLQGAQLARARPARARGRRRRPARDRRARGAGRRAASAGLPVVGADVAGDARVPRRSPCAERRAAARRGGRDRPARGRPRRGAVRLDPGRVPRLRARAALAGHAHRRARPPRRHRRAVGVPQRPAGHLRGDGPHRGGAARARRPRRRGLRGRGERHELARLDRRAWRRGGAARRRRARGRALRAAGALPRARRDRRARARCAWVRSTCTSARSRSRWGGSRTPAGTSTRRARGRRPSGLPVGGVGEDRTAPRCTRRAGTALRPPRWPPRRPPRPSGSGSAARPRGRAGCRRPCAGRPSLWS